MVRHRFVLPILICLFVIPGATGCIQDKENKVANFEYSPIRTPEQELETFQLVPGLKIELVASEPLVEDPVVMTFDEDGRLWVVEMRGFMPDIDGTNEEAPIGRISVLHDEDGDGTMDRRSTFLDSLVLPRALAIVDGGALVAENKPLWYVKDEDGDLVADAKQLIDPEYGGSGLPEHSANGLLRGLDNWYYNAKSRSRYRLINGEWQRDATEFRGQWGISHDDKGRLYYNYNWSQLHADLVPPNYLSRNANHTPTSGLDVGLTLNRSVFPVRSNLAVNRGYVDGSLDEKGRLREFTSAGAPLVYRGRALPQEYYGNVFVTEPAGNLIKRNIVSESDFSLTSHFAYPDKEFLASTDERFRPVFMTTGPDGALYIADMYRGIIQHGAYMTPYLREQTLNRGLEEPVHFGRIWRIVPSTWETPAPVQLSVASTESLIRRLSHPDGWHRDMSQRLLIERNDPRAISLLEEMVMNGERSIGRLHALWVLEGMGVKSISVYERALIDSDPTVQSAALRILEGLALRDEGIQHILSRALDEMWDTASSELAVQMALTASVLPEMDTVQLLANLLNRYPDQPVMRDAILSSLEGHEFALLQRLWESPGWNNADGSEKPEASIFLEMLASAIVRGGAPGELRDLLSLAEQEPSPNDWRSEALLMSFSIHGNARRNEAVELDAPPVILASDRAIETRYPELERAIKQLFRWPGHSPDIRPLESEEEGDGSSQSLIAQGRQRYLTGCAGCHGLDGQGLPRFAPPLTQSEWVSGTEERLVRIVLHGVEGPIEVGGILYDEPDILTVMPAHSVLDDTEIASILTYIRQAWGNQAPPVLPRTVGRIRHGSQGQVTPWRAEELLRIPEEPDAQ